MRKEINKIRTTRPLRSIKHRSKMGSSKARGNTLLLMIFVIVVMSALTAAMTKISLSQSDMTTKEIAGLRASLFSISLMEVQMTKLYPPLTNNYSDGAAAGLLPDYALESEAMCIQSPNNAELFFGATYERLSSYNCDLISGAAALAAPPICTAVKVAISGAETQTLYNINATIVCSPGTEYETLRQSEVWTKDMLDALGG